MADPTPNHCILASEEQSNRRSEMHATIVPHVVAVTSLADGIRLGFDDNEGLRDTVEEFIVFEQGCCSFLTFTLSPAEEELSLLIQGPSSAVQVIEMFRRTAQGGRAMSDESSENSSMQMKRFGVTGVAIIVLSVLACELPIVLALIGLGGLSSAAVFSPAPMIEMLALALALIALFIVSSVLVFRFVSRAKS